MQFEEGTRAKEIGIVTGYMVSYALFTTILFGMLTFAGKIPESWTYLSIVAITAPLSCVGFIVQGLLK